MASLKSSLPQTIPTQRLILELFDYSPAHYDCLLSCINNPTTYKMLGDINIRTPAAFDAMNRSARLASSACGDLAVDTDLYYVAKLKEQNTFVGGVSLMQRAANTPPDMGWAVLEGYMGKGYATEAASALIQMVKETLGVKSLMAWPGVSNAASARVAEKVGLVRGGLLPDREGDMHAVYILPHMEFDENMALSLWGS